jgi:hypothetical protein
MNRHDLASTQFCLGLALVLLFQFANAQESDALLTGTNNQLGLTISAYQYKEPAPDVVINAPLVGLDYTGTYAFANDWFVRADARYAYGPAKYNGSGTQNNIPYSYYDVRGLFGYDFSFSELGGFVLAPYTGIAYRYLFDNQGGQTSSGSSSYNRESNYVYLPLGITHRMKMDGNHQLETVLEYDHLIQGTQVSHLSQASSYLSDVTNQQYRGYGLRLSSMYYVDAWSFGPYVNYWNIQDSNRISQSVVVNGTRYTSTWYEPANTTLELGLKLAYSF